MLSYLLLICCFWCIPNCLFGQTVINVAPGVYSTKRQSDGLTLPATSGTFQPIGELTTKIHLTKSHSVLVHYQVTISSSNTDFWSKLQVNHFNAGSLVNGGSRMGHLGQMPPPPPPLPSLPPFKKLHTCKIEIL